jgi:calpain-9
MNPQLVITVPDATDVILSVAQNNALEPQVIGFTGYDLSEEASADGTMDTTKDFFKTKRSLVNSQYTNSRQVTLRTRFAEGFYLIVPTTYEPNQVSPKCSKYQCGNPKRN